VHGDVIARFDLSRSLAPVSIRLAHEHEVYEIAALFVPALEPYRGRDGDWIVDAYLAELLDVRGRFDLAETYVAHLDGRLAGTIAFYRDVTSEGWSNFPGGWSGFRALAVHPSARGAGVGRALVQRCIDRARTLGAPTLGIHSIALLADAVRLYARTGFVRCPEYDLRARDVFPSKDADDMVGLAFRRDLS
jgi:predicted N-acetyltransferase YhbS